MTFDLSTLTLKALPKTRYDSETEEEVEVSEGEEGDVGEWDPWLKNVTCLIMLDGKQVGMIRAEIIVRYMMQGEFYSLLDEVDQEHYDLGVTLFDNSGSLRPDFVAPAGRKAGTGVFGDELSEGSFAYITDLTIAKPEHRSQGLGTAVLDLSKTFLRSSPTCHYVSSILCWPTLNYDEPENKDSDNDNWDPFSSKPRVVPPAVAAARERNTTRLNAFWLNNGFRRVGTSQFLAYMLHDEDHPSRHLAAHADQPDLIAPAETSDDLQRDFPLHFLIENGTYPRQPNGEFTNPTIEAILRSSPLSVIQTPDARGITVLHIAAGRGILSLIQILVSRSRKELLSKTFAGQTPLDNLRETVQSIQDFMTTFDLQRKADEVKRMADCEKWLEAETLKEQAAEASRKRKAGNEAEGSAAAGGSRARV